MRTVLLAVGVGMSVGLVASSCGTALCTSDAQCGTGQACLPSGVCALTCTSDTQCRPQEKCSASGGCVARQGGCGTQADCPRGQLCQSGGQCEAPSTPGPGGADAGPATCGGEKFEATRTQANMLIVLDHSGSMTEQVGNTSKWNAAVNAVRGVTSQYGDQIRFGLQLFSFLSPSCAPGTVSVAPGDNTATAISMALPSTADGRQTPIAGALSVAAHVPELADPSRANFVLLITDGKENCSGDPVGAVGALFNSGVRTYTVGFGGAVDQRNLSDMAVRGGTARMSGTRYYQADSPADLEQALASIAQGALGCDFHLAQTPPDPTKLYVAIDGQLVPRDPSRVSGWEYTAASNRLTLYGPPCDVMAHTSGAKLSIVYGCPDPAFIEGGGTGDAGYTFTLDAGMIN